MAESTKKIDDAFRDAIRKTVAEAKTFLFNEHREGAVPCACGAMYTTDPAAGSDTALGAVPTWLCSSTCESGWLRAKTAVAGWVGQTMNDGALRLEAIEPTRLAFSRTKTGSPVNVSQKLLNRCWRATAKGGTLTNRAPGPHGISCTSAVQFAVVLALGLKRRDDGTWGR